MALLLRSRYGQVGAFQRIQDAQKVLALAENNLRSARSGSLFFFLVLHKIRTSHGQAAPARFPQETRKRANRAPKKRGKLLKISNKAIMWRGSGAVKFSAACMCPMRHGLARPRRRC